MSGSRLNKPFLGNELGRLFAHAQSDSCNKELFAAYCLGREQQGQNWDLLGIASIDETFVYPVAPKLSAVTRTHAATFHFALRERFIKIC